MGIENRWVGLKGAGGGDVDDDDDGSVGGPDGCRVCDRWKRVTGAGSSGVVDTSERETDL